MDLTPAQAADLLQETPLFRDAARSDVEEIAGLARQEHVLPGKTLFEKGEPSESLYLLVDGRILIRSPSRGGKDFLHGSVEPGSLFGELALVDGSTRITSAVADRRSHFLDIDRRLVLPVLAKNPACAIALSGILGRHLKSTLEDLAEVGLSEAKARLWHRFMVLGQRFGHVEPDSSALRIDHRLSQKDLAESVGLTRVMVNRQLAHWRDIGLIEFGRGYIEIPDPDALANYIWEQETLPDSE